MTRAWWILAGGLVVLAAACGDDGGGSDPKPVKQLTLAELKDPESCKDCHPKHYEEWSASMHAYAGRDPVFLAMNKRMQEEAPQHKEFCVQCHAPMALRENAITDFSDPSTLPKHLQGVTCYFCHNAINVREPHYFNANIDLANDTIMRGALGDPDAEAAAHGVTTKSKWHDPSSIESSKMCGTCHDIQAPSGVMIERTFSEYMMSVSAKPGAGNFNSCQDCHMKKKPMDEPAAVVAGKTGNRTVHSHLFPAVDIGLTPDAPNQAELRAAIEKSELQACTLSQMTVEFGNSLAGEPFEFVVTLEQLAGHSFPSGAAADRRLWIQSALYDDAGQLIFESGKVADGEVEQKPEGDPKYDSQLVPFRDHLIDANGNETHMFWEAAQPSKSDLLPYSTDPAVPHSTTRTIRTRSPLPKPPARIELWLRLRPMGVDVLQDLVKSGHLDPSFVNKMPTLTVAHREYTLSASGTSYTEKDLITDSECKTAQSLSELTGGM